MRREATRTLETALTSKTQSQADESRLLRELEEVKQRSREEMASLRESLKNAERQSHDLEVQVARTAFVQNENESLRKTVDRMMHDKEVEGSLSPTLVYFLLLFFWPPISADCCFGLECKHGCLAPKPR